VRNLAKAVLVFCVLMIVLASMTHLQTPQETLVAGFVALLIFLRLQSRKRSRYIPKATRRAVIERDLKGEKFDPEKHHIDHVWPFSRGGSHTTDNLRVIEKKQNLRKGAKRPRMRDMW
jgi:5-methylcytosine-specific restriction endonuclease McrA